MSSSKQRNTHLRAKRWKSPVVAQGILMRRAKRRAGWHIALDTHARVEECGDRCGKAANTTRCSHPDPAYCMCRRNISTSFKGENSAGGDSCQIFLHCVHYRGLAGRLRKTRASSCAVSSPLGYTDLTAVWVAGSTGV